MADLDHTIHEILATQGAVGKSMQLLIDAHAKSYPSGDWPLQNSSREIWKRPLMLKNSLRESMVAYAPQDAETFAGIG